MSAPEVITFGCRLNRLESEVIRTEAGKAGLEGAVIINTCAVTNEAIRQARQTIRKTNRQRPSARIIVTGCAAQLMPQQFADLPGVEAVLGNVEKLSAKTYADFGVGTSEKIRVNDIMSVRETAGHMIATLSGRTRAFVQIQNGCDHRCTFCIIPFARGPSRSVPAGDVVRQVELLVANGYREIVLTGVDITAYGADLPGNTNLGKLCAAILKRVPGLPRLRLSSVDTVEIDPEMEELLFKEPRVMPHMHLSLQSGDDLILKRMKRRHTRKHVIDFCTRMRAHRPEVAFGADMIAGFPTESDAMFENSLAMIEDAGLNFLHVFPFSARPGTPAARMPQVPGDVRRGRAARLRLAGEAASQKFFAAELGNTRRVLIEECKDGIASGHTENFAPIRFEAEADGIVDVTVTGRDGFGLRGHRAA